MSSSSDDAEVVTTVLLVHRKPQLNHHKYMYSILTSNSTLHRGKHFLDSGSYLIERRFAATHV
ncbi:hypothetical protein E2C01_066935 [Portunus trituberculatus]|uniref:Uncharacterized protein n=1 Tax=Portunus trituberculatus TaxID=210409 RepID=A0A5B7HRC9_PORTR|nr:hypothetical protein [Portunus trituberculatus]